MDILKIKTKLVRGIIAHVLEKVIKDKFGYTVSLSIEDIDVSITDDNAHFHVSIGGDMPASEFTKIDKLIE